MVLEVILSSGFLIIAILIIVQFNRLITANKNKQDEFASHLLDWEKKMDGKQETMQGNVANYMQELNKALTSVQTETKHEIKELFTDQVNTFKETLQSLEEKQDQFHKNLMQGSEKSHELLENLWGQKNQELVHLLEKESESRETVFQRMMEIQEVSSGYLQSQNEKVVELSDAITTQSDRLIEANENRHETFMVHLLDWEKKMDEKQETMQGNVANYMQELNKALTSVQTETKHEIKELFTDQVNTFKETLQSLEEKQDQFHKNLMQGSEKSHELLGNLWGQKNQELVHLLEKESESRETVFQRMMEIQEVSDAHLQVYKQEVTELLHSNTDIIEKLVRFTGETKEIAVVTERYHQGISDKLTSFTSSMHQLFDTKVKEQHDLLLQSEKVIYASMEAIVQASDRNLQKYEESVQKMTDVQHTQSEVFLLMKKSQQEHHDKLEEYQEELQEKLEDIFDNTMDEIKKRFAEQNGETQLILVDIKDEVHQIVSSVEESNKVTESTYNKFGVVLDTLDDSLRKNIATAQNIQMEMKTIGEKDIKLLEKMLR